MRAQNVVRGGCAPGFFLLLVSVYSWFIDVAQNETNSRTLFAKEITPTCVTWPKFQTYSSGSFKKWPLSHSITYIHVYARLAIIRLSEVRKETKYHPLMRYESGLVAHNFWLLSFICYFGGFLFVWLIQGLWPMYRVAFSFLERFLAVSNT